MRRGWWIFAVAVLILASGPAIVSTTDRIGRVIAVARNAGFSGQDLVIAVAIALAESGGDPLAHGDLSIGSGRGSFGLWQIYADAHPEFGPDFESLYDPQRNANAAYSVYRNAGYSFTPWTTFKNNTYASYLAEVGSSI